MTTQGNIANEAWRAYPHTYAARLSEGRYAPYPHLRLVSLKIVELLDAGGGTLLVSMPPRHGKSETISRWTPEWFLQLYATRRVILLSYAADLAEEWSRRARNGFIEHGGAISDDKAGVAWWVTKAGGSMSAAGLGGPITGKGGDLIIIDDAIKNAEEADSETIREKQRTSWNQDIWTRREKGCLIVLLMTRWREDDLYGYVKSVVPDAHEIVMPAICEDEADPIGRMPGDVLCSERIDRKMLDEARAVLTEREWQALFQQRPTAAEGAEIKRHWWQWYEELPVKPELFELRALSVDATFRDSDGSDYVVILAAGVYGTFRYVVDLVRERMTFVETLTAITTMAQKHRPHVIIVEAKANGDAIIQTLQRAGLSNVVPITPTASKLARARAASPQIEAGSVWLPKTKWAEELVEEHAAFPLGKHDDQVDAMSQLLNYLADMRNNPRYDLQPGDNTWVSPDIAAERRAEVDPWGGLLAKVRRSI